MVTAFMADAVRLWGCAVDMTKAVHRRAARRKERVRKLDVDSAAADSLKQLKQVGALRGWHSCQLDALFCALHGNSIHSVSFVSVMHVT